MGRSSSTQHDDRHARLGRRLWLPLALLAGLLAVLAWPRPAQAAGPAEAPAPDGPTLGPGATTLYLPVIFRNYPPYLWGRVTQGGLAAPGVSVTLRFYNGVAWSTVATTTTTTDGAYRFFNPAPLAPGQKYQARYDNTAQVDGRLARWTTRDVLNYHTGGIEEIGSFDIADVPLTGPVAGIWQTLPALFTWTRRPATSSDIYSVRLYDPTDQNPLIITTILGYVESYTLNSLPSGINLGGDYAWDVLIRRSDGASGLSRLSRPIKFVGGIYGRVRDNGNLAGGVALQLRFYNGSSWSTMFATTSAADGLYLFANAPTLSSGQQYYVRYENTAQTNGRLFSWSTRTLTSYVVSQSVAIGEFDVADVALVGPTTGVTVTLPTIFQWTRRPATTNDSYALEIYDPTDFQPRWLSPALGYSGNYTLSGLPAGLVINTRYAWDIIVTSPDGGSGVSRLARLITFRNIGSSAPQGSAAGEAGWPFPEPLSPRPASSLVGQEADSRSP